MADEFVEIESLELTPRRENRAAAMQYVYMCEVSGGKTSDELVSEFFAGKARDRKFYAFAEDLIAGVYSNLEKIDERIAQAAENWSFHRIAKVDLALLRVAVFEMFYRDDVPSIVAINEAIDLSKLFSGPDSKRFINGVLDMLKASAPKKSSEKK
jgi:transcription antitermination factor NusB